MTKENKKQTIGVIVMVFFTTIQTITIKTRTDV